MTSIEELDVQTADGRTVHAYDRPPETSPILTVIWHHGTPNLGSPPEPLFDLADELGIRWVSFDRPSYGRSSPNPDRDVASIGDDVAAVADALELNPFAVMGHSGGGPHALACAALLPDRVVAAVSISGLAPLNAEGLDWFAGMTASGEASLRAALSGRAEKERYEEAHGAEYDPEFTEGDAAALSGKWSWLNRITSQAAKDGPDGLIDDDIAYVSPWGFDPSQVVAPALFLHGGRDRIVPPAHGEWLAEHCRNAEFRLVPDAGHISILNSATAALRWLRERAG